MNKTELIDYIQSNTGLSNAGASRALHITLLAITRTLKHGEDVTLMGFGSFRARQAAHKFRLLNIRNLDRLYPYYKDKEEMVSQAKQARDELEAMFALDAEAVEAERKAAWE